MEVKAGEAFNQQVLSLLVSNKKFSAVRSFTPELLAGDGSGRRFTRLIPDPKVKTAILIESPAGIGPKLSGDNSLSQAQAFAELCRFLPSAGIPVPELYATDKDCSLMLTEDLGDLAFFQLIDKTNQKNREVIEELIERYSDLLVPELFKQAINLIKTLQSIPKDEKLVCFRKYLAFENYRAEIQEFSDFYLGDKLKNSEAQQLQKIYDSICEVICSFPKTLSFFDYNTHNLFVTPDGHLRVLDFQDACLTSPARDLFSLINDRGMNEMIGDSLHKQLYDYYKHALNTADDFDFIYDMTALHWDLRVSGRFIKLNQKFNTDRYEQWIPSTVRRLATTLKRLEPSFDSVHDLIEISRRASPQFKDCF